MDIYTHVLEGSENGDTMRASDTHVSDEGGVSIN